MLNGASNKKRSFETFEIEDLTEKKKQRSSVDADFREKLNHIHINIVIDKMNNLLDLIMCAVNGNNLFLKYLECNEKHRQQIEEFSESIDDCLLFPSDEEKYLLALAHFKRSGGYSMFRFLKKNNDLTNFLYRHLDELAPIQNGLLLFYQREMLMFNRALLSKTCDGTKKRKCADLGFSSLRASR